jgi:DNA-binding beta-propeller fold protein YncE
MSLQPIGEIELPAHHGSGGFDHAAVHGRLGRLYVAHTANSAIDVIDCANHTYRGPITGLEAVAGALVCEERDLVFTSNRGENTVGIFTVDREVQLARVKVGVKPNGLAYDPGRGLLIAANVGEPSRLGSFSISVVDVGARRMIASIPVPGRTRWSVFDTETGWFYVNIADPPQIVIVESAKPDRVAQTFAVTAGGPHGLDLDAASRRLFCACDDKTLVALDCQSGREIARAPLAGGPDVIFFNRERGHLYVASGDPGVVEVFETDELELVQTVQTGPGAHTIGLDQLRNTVYAFLPETHRALVFQDGV